MSDFLTLSQLQAIVREKIEESFPSTFWLMAETLDLRVSNRHCYLEFVEKDDRSSAILAKARGYIWANTFDMLKPYFEQTTGQAFVSGIKILVKVGIEFHPLYGYGLNVYDIDPSYTLGDMQLKKRAILNQLREDGIINMNKELELDLLPQRIAVISSATAAGYEDFQKQLVNNSYGFVFYTRLFPAVMQGEQTEKSVISALNAIYERMDLFDAVVIIRGGGATSDLASFDSYPLASNCAQFPLPIITGIGHERDETVLDYVAFHREKTPTAVAEYFIGLSRSFSEQLNLRQNQIVDSSIRMLNNSQARLKEMETSFPFIANNLIEKQSKDLDILKIKTRNACQRLLSIQESRLNEKEAFLKLSSPEYILAKGYSITLKDGKALKSVDQLKEGDEIETLLEKGRIKSIVEKI